MNHIQRRREGWSPFQEISRLRNEISRLMESPDALSRSELFGGWSPPVDVAEDKDNFIVKAEMPGMKKEDIDISMEGNTLCICGERREEPEESAGAEMHRTERFYGRFQRNLTLPQPVEAGKIEARYKDGVLTIKLPKSEAARRKQIHVQTSE